MSLERGAIPATICNQKDYLEVVAYYIILEVRPPPMETGNGEEGGTLIVRTVR